MRTLLLSLVMLTGLAACSETASVTPRTPDASDGLVLTTDRQTYAPGATATVTFRNETSGAVSLDQPLACVTVEREASGEWSPVPSDRMCATVLVSVEAGQAETVEITVPDQAGTYRLSQTVYPGEGEGRTVPSPAFQVR